MADADASDGLKQYVDVEGLRRELRAEDSRLDFELSTVTKCHSAFSVAAPLSAERHPSSTSRQAPSTQRQLTTSFAIYPHLASAALTTSDPCPTLAQILSVEQV
ncbi:hypothetical protein [uncultured Microbacterium sp.]|uniref:hypothetical protein n=1 Tax=uncultured Microbacterium sp. TaxID=191216 RepID=UPI0035CA1FA2